MLETTSFWVHACRFLYSAASGYFILSGLLAGVYYSRFRERFAARHFFLCLSLLIYSLISFIYTFGAPEPEVSRLLITTIYIIGPTSFIIYTGMVTQLIHARPKWLPYLLSLLCLLPIGMVLDFFFHYGLGIDLFFETKPNYEVRNWFMKMPALGASPKPTMFLVFLPTIASLFLVSALLLIKYNELLKRETLLRMGLFATFASQIHDISLTLFDPKYLFPLAFLGYLFEVIRFNMSLVERYIRHNDRMSARLKNSLMTFAQVRLSKQIIHDIKSIRRNLLFELEQKKLNNLTEILGRQIKRLEVYDRDDAPKTSERIYLKEICFSTAALFEKEFREQECKVDFDIPEDIWVKANRDDMMIVLINLIQNSLDALNGTPDIWICFEAFEDENRVALRISDSGQISEEAALQIFKPGFSSKGISRGLGLNIVQECLAANGALISLCPKSKNTVFQIEFFKPEDSKV